MGGSRNAWIQRGGGGGAGGPDPPEKSQKHSLLGFHSNTGTDQIKITKLPSHHSKLGGHQFNEILYFYGNK